MNPVRELHKWSGLEPLPNGQSLLLEASAGTGKTWQIAHLIARLVAEEGVTIDRMLIITFTKDATAELRTRVRERLQRVQQALEAEVVDPSWDPLLKELVAASPLERRQRLANISAAVGAFDQAPISTIHSFCQRMLTQFAFESGQSPGLDVITDSNAIVEELVSDELAALYANTDEKALEIAEQVGWTREGLTELAKAATLAVLPEIHGAQREPSDTSEGPALAVIAQWKAAVADFRAWFEGPEGQASLQALRDEMTKPTAAQAKKGELARGWPGGYGKTLLKAAKSGVSRLDELQKWLKLGATPRKDWKKILEPWDFQNAKSNWSPNAGDFSAFAGAAVFAQITALRQQLEKIQGSHGVVARQWFVASMRQKIDDELERRRVLSYEAMLWRLAQRITQEGPEGTLAQAIRAQFAVALVDEFQDTDQAQWAVLSSVFAAAGRRLLLIGDPKQSIYRFRGADIHVYLLAAEHTAQAGRQATMDTNWRSDAALIGAMNHVWREDSKAFGDVGFDYVQVQARPKAPAFALDAPQTPGSRERRRALEIRWIDASHLGQKDGVVISSKPPAIRLAHEAVVREVCRLLQPDCLLKTGSDPARPVRPSDIAILVRKNAHGEEICRRLLGAGIPAVVSSNRKVTESDAAQWLIDWLEAVSAPGNERAARTAAACPLFGWTLPELVAAIEREQMSEGASADPQSPEASGPRRDWAAWLGDIKQWALRWSSDGFVRLWEDAQHRHGVLEHLLSVERGERHATDLRHLVELCHARERTYRTSPAALAQWLRQQREESGEEHEQRLESDAHAVRIVTIHKSKGLEYPIVLLPYLWESHAEKKDEGQPLVWHDPSDGKLKVHLGTKGEEARKDILEQLNLEVVQEDLRMLYVALTRARHHVVVWMIPAGEVAKNPQNNAWARLLLRNPGARGDIGKQEMAGEPKSWPSRIASISKDSGETIGFMVEEVPEEPLAPVLAQDDVPPTLAARPWTRERLQDGWIVTSYSRLVRELGGDGDTHRETQRPGTLMPQEAKELEADAKAQAGEEEGAEGLEAVLQTFMPEVDPKASSEMAQDWSQLPAGAQLGNWVHRVLEKLDFVRSAEAPLCAKDKSSLEQLCRAEAVYAGLTDPSYPATLTRLVPLWLATPLDGAAPLPKGFALQDAPLRDRLDEFQFDMSLGTGLAEPTLKSAAVHSRLKGALESARAGGLFEQSPSLAWLGALLTAKVDLFDNIHGILTGTIDLLLRVDGRYFVADYKTNRLRDPNRAIIPVSGYTRETIAREMAHSGYHLQSLVYTLATHRWLRQRLGAGYDFDRHVGGHLYLFLRGMDGGRHRHEGGSTGVYFDRWPRVVVEALDRALSPTAEDVVDYDERGVMG